MTSSTKPVVHKVSQRRQRTEPRPRATRIKISVKFGRVILELCDWTDRQTKILITILRSPLRGKVITAQRLRWSRVNISDYFLYTAVHQTSAQAPVFITIKGKRPFWGSFWPLKSIGLLCRKAERLRSHNMSMKPRASVVDLYMWNWSCCEVVPLNPARGDGPRDPLR